MGRFFGSQFLSHTQAVDLLSKFKLGLSKLDQVGMVQISMDSWAFFEKLLQVRAESVLCYNMARRSTCGREHCRFGTTFPNML